MKKLIAALSLLFVLSLTACGNSDAALRQENEALRQQILALEAERDNLTKENKDLTEENAALDDTAPESGDDEANPIDRFFEGVDVGSSTAEMNRQLGRCLGIRMSECCQVAEGTAPASGGSGIGGCLHRLCRGTVRPDGHYGYLSHCGPHSSAD